jgi:hypothetical protein
MKIIWVRHGTVDCNTEDADTLTPKGREFSKALPDLLEENDIRPEVVFYDASKKFGKTITRCKETVAGLVGRAEMIPYTFNDVDPIFKRCKEGEVTQAIICYTSESLKRFQKIEGSICAKYMGNAESCKARKTTTNMLYKYMIVSEYDGSVIRQISIIATGDGK